jgi:hypothetical protein
MDNNITRSLISVTVITVGDALGKWFWITTSLLGVLDAHGLGSARTHLRYLHVPHTCRDTPAHSHTDYAGFRPDFSTFSRRSWDRRLAIVRMDKSHQGNKGRYNQIRELAVTMVLTLICRIAVLDTRLVLHTQPHTDGRLESPSALL